MFPRSCGAVALWAQAQSEKQVCRDVLMSDSEAEVLNGRSE